MSATVVVDERCTGCLACIEVCPAGAVTEVSHVWERAPAVSDVRGHR